ncbi:unnamed protein product [Ectocarpus sp. 12 AP-2014]
MTTTRSPWQLKRGVGTPAPANASFRARQYNPPSVSRDREALASQNRTFDYVRHAWPARRHATPAPPYPLGRVRIAERKTRYVRISSHVHMACAATTTIQKRHEKHPAAMRTSEKSTIRAPSKFHSNTNNQLTGTTAAVGTVQKMVGSHPPNLKLTAHHHASTPDASTLACVVAPEIKRK